MDNWAKNSIGRKTIGGNIVMAENEIKKPKRSRSRKKKAEKPECSHLICAYGNQEPGGLVVKIWEKLPQPNFWAGLQLPYCPRCGEKLTKPK